MATERAVGIALATLLETFPTREITAQTVTVWTKVLADTNDDQLGRAILRLCRDSERRFFPTTGELFAEIQTEIPKPVVDFEQIQHRISALGSYNPNIGWAYPSVEKVKESLGEAVGAAYGACGGRRLFADDEIGRSIAEREFRQELEVQAAGGKLATIAAPKQKQLNGTRG